MPNISGKPYWIIFYAILWYYFHTDQTYTYLFIKIYLYLIGQLYCCITIRFSLWVVWCQTYPRLLIVDPHLSIPFISNKWNAYSKNCLSEIIGNINPKLTLTNSKVPCICCTKYPQIPNCNPFRSIQIITLNTTMSNGTQYVALAIAISPKCQSV